MIRAQISKLIQKQYLSPLLRYLLPSLKKTRLGSGGLKSPSARGSPAGATRDFHPPQQAAKVWQLGWVMVAQITCWHPIVFLSHKLQGVALPPTHQHSTRITTGLCLTKALCSSSQTILLWHTHTHTILCMHTNIEAHTHTHTHKQCPAHVWIPLWGISEDHQLNTCYSQVHTSTT